MEEIGKDLPLRLRNLISQGGELFLHWFWVIQSLLAITIPRTQGDLLRRQLALLPALLWVSLQLGLRRNLIWLLQHLNEVSHLKAIRKDWFIHSILVLTHELTRRVSLYFFERFIVVFLHLFLTSFHLF